MKTLAEIETWLRKRIAEEIRTPPDNVSLKTPFANYGLDSIVIVTIAGDLEDWLGAPLDPTIFWEYPTVEELSRWLAEGNVSR